MHYQIIIVIGLPGSGKSSFCRKFSNDGYLIFDDFISKFFDGSLIETIASGSNVCINDPRLCFFHIFSKYISILEQIVPKNNILLYLFGNDPIQCFANLTKRNDLRKISFNTLLNYSQHYDILNYNKWNYHLLKIHV
jgi:GTPase SAR1 family protein